MAVDVSKIPNSKSFDSVREAILELDDSISDTGASVNNTQITIAAGTNMTGGGVFTLNQSNTSTITLNADDQSLTDAQVKTAYENNADTNAFTDAEKTKLGNITSTGSGDIITTTERTKLSNVEDNATADQTANEILNLIKSVDGTGSGLDADLLDGEEGGYYLNYANFYGNNSVAYNSSGQRVARGIIYYVGTETVESDVNDDRPSTASTYNFTTGIITFATNGYLWSQVAPASNSANGTTLWISRWEATDVGTRNVIFDTVTSSSLFEGVVTFSNLEESGFSVIDGGNITTGSIQSAGFSAGTDGFSTQGTKINLVDGSIEAENFRINSSGDAKFKGSLDVVDGALTVDSINGVVSTNNVTMDSQTISLVSSSSANIGEINFIEDDSGSTTEVASIQNFSGSLITNPQFKIETKTAGGQLYFRGADAGGSTDFQESIRMVSVKDMSIKSRCSLIGGTLTYHIDDTLNGTDDSTILVALNTASVAANKSLIVEVVASCDTHAVFALFGCRASGSGAWSMERRVHTGDTGNLEVEETTSSSNTIRMQNKTSSFSLPANAVIRISGSSDLMRFDRLEEILSFVSVNRATFQTS